MASGGGGDTFPDELDPITVPLPIPIPRPREDDLVELTFTFTKGLERQYGGGELGEAMSAARYDWACEVAANSFGLVVNQNTGKLEGALAMIANAAAKYAAFHLPYTKQEPPQPVPANPGAFTPFSTEVLTVLDGTAAFRGFCAGVHSLDPDAVGTVDVQFGPLWGKGRPPGGNK